MNKWLYAACLGVMLIGIACGGSAWAKTLQVGGTSRKARIVFEMDARLTPVLSRESQTLNVNFPNTIGEPALISDTFIIEKLTFDGRTARISMKRPFTYTTTILDSPARFVIDIADADVSPSEVRPIEHIEATLNDDGITVAFSIDPDHWPEIRILENERVYFFFGGEVSYSETGDDLVSAPYLAYAGTVKIQSGTGLVFSFIDEHASYEVLPDEINTQIIVHITTTEKISRSKSYTIAKNAFDHGDVSAAIRTLDRFKDSLDAKESILLGTAYWAVSFPYRSEGVLMDALRLMSEGIQAMSPGPERERAMLDYTGMLLRTGMYTEASNYIRFLKESASDEVALRANIQEIDMMNKMESFQDAFVENRRMKNVFDLNAMPETLKGYYFSVVADTYLGLNAYSKALRFYEDASREDPGIFRYDPGLYSHIASASYNLKDYARAKKYVLLAINLGNPADKANHLLELGDCLYQLGEKDKAMSVFAEVENISPKSDSGIIAKLRTARILLEQDLETHGMLTDKVFYKIMDIYESIKASEEYREGPLGSLVKIRIAQTFALKEDWDNALEAYHRAWLDTKKDNPIHEYAQTEAEKTILSRIRILYQQDDHELIYDLYTLYEDSFMNGIKQADALFILGDSMWRLDYPDKARPLLITVARGSSARKPQAIATLFTMDYRQGDYSRALQWNSAYLEGFPDGPEAGLMRQTRGELLYYMNEANEAIVYLEPVSTQGDDRSLTALSMLADIYRGLGDHEKEAGTLDRIIALRTKMTSPIIERALYVRAKQLITAADTSRAQTLLREMIDTYPASSFRNWANYHLAIIAHITGRSSEARTILNDVVQSGSDSVLISTASSYLREMDLGGSIAEYHELKNRFGGK